MYFLPLLLQILFKYYNQYRSSSYLNDKLVKSKKNSKLYYIWSADRINGILTHKDKEVSNCVKNLFKFQLCSKVDYIIDNNEDQIKYGYVMHEISSYIQVLTIKNNLVFFQKLKYNKLQTAIQGTNKICYDLNDNK